MRAPMGTMGVPPSVLRRKPVSGMISNSGRFSVKKAGLPQPAPAQPC